MAFRKRRDPDSPENQTASRARTERSLSAAQKKLGAAKNAQNEPTSYRGFRASEKTRKAAWDVRKVEDQQRKAASDAVDRMYQDPETAGRSRRTAKTQKDGKKKRGR